VSVPAIQDTKPLQIYTSDRTASWFDIATWHSVTASLLTY